MNPIPRPLRTLSFVLAASIASQSFAQFFPGGGGGGGFGGGGGGAGRSGTGSSSRSYLNNTEVGDAIFSYDPETRKIIVVTDENTNLKIKNVITSLDNPRPQVLIKVVFLEVTHNNSSDIGVEGGYTRQLGNTGTGSIANAFGSSALSSSATSAVPNALGQNIQNMLPVPPGAGVYQVLGSDFQATLKAIAQAGKAEILSRPSILARNNQPATISLGQQVPLVSNTRFDAINGQINTVSYQNVGIIVRVTPFISSDGMVEMIVSPETSALAERSSWVPISKDALAPVVNSRLADTVVVVPDGQTVIIGGLMQNQISESESKVPLLGDIPWLGNAFKRKQKSNLKTELMIFLTPIIIPAPGQLAAMTAEERSRVLLKPKSLPQEQLENLVDQLPDKSSPKIKSADKPAEKATPKPASKTSPRDR
jgi:general secretion pathway protein D